RMEQRRGFQRVRQPSVTRLGQPRSCTAETRTRRTDVAVIMPKQPASHSPARNVGDHATGRRPSVDRGYPTTLTAIQCRKQPRVAAAHARTVALWLTVAKVVVWVSLVIVIDVAVGRALQLAAENIATADDASRPAPPMVVVN